MEKLIVVTSRDDFNFELEDARVVTAREYLTGKIGDAKNVRVYNLCRSYRYQAAGYYVSLLAEAWGHRAVPSITTIQDFKSQTVMKSLSDDLDLLIQRKLAHITSREFTLSIYFGKNLAKRYDELSRAFYNIFEAPLLRAQFVRNKKWALQGICPISMKDIEPTHLPYVHEFARKYFSGRKVYISRKSRMPYSIAILTDPEDKSPPSDDAAIRKFMKAAPKRHMDAYLIERDSIARVGEYDGLFIRATTSVTDFTYRFARKASAEGLVVIDDPLSILRCTNKVYLAELLSRYRIPCPKTLVIHKDNIELIEKDIGFPCVLKQPDSSFSIGVAKVGNSGELHETLASHFEKSDFVVAQEYMPTDFDWRIGVLDRKPLYACKYHMARGHWQIYNWKAEGAAKYGKWDTLLVEQTPPRIVETALKAANLIGDGFYGVDLKERHGRVYVIEVNDNPSIESGVEDLAIHDHLYDTIMKVFFTRMRRLREERVHERY
jgi:glutathione synthase/RimK-type ligase-like ATP-grasp enzyme